MSTNQPIFKNKNTTTGYSWLMLVILITSLIMSACSQAATSEPTKLKIAVLPILDTLPMYVAQQEGLFAKQNVNVELIQVGSAPERDQVIASGQVDGMINETVSTIFSNREAKRIQIVRYARAATPETPLFRILVADNSGIDKVEQLKGTEIGISQGTVIEYLTDRLLQAQGFSTNEINTVAVPDISSRMALLGTGELKAAMLPEPLSTLAVQQGSMVILDDTQNPEYSYSVIAFRKPVIDEYPEAIRGFLTAIEEAVRLINADPAKYNSLLSDLQLVPPPLAGTYEVPTFVTAGVPTEAQWADALAWTIEKGLNDVQVPYQDSVTDQFLP